MSTFVKQINDKTKFYHLLMASFVAVAVAFSAYILLGSRAADVPSVPQFSTELPANEASGLVASRQYPGVMWWQRDGGTSTASAPRNALYALKFDASGTLQPVRGSEKFPFYNVAGDTNTQWEDITLDDQNNMWIGEIGSNDCKSAQYLYKLDEPNPASTASLTIKATYSLKFPDPEPGCTTKNAEAMFWLDGHMYIFSKEKDSPVYRVDLPGGGSGSATLTRLGSLAGVNTISGSSISDDRTRMVVQHHQKMFIYVSGNPSLKGDAYVKDMIARSFKWSAWFGDGSGTVEGASFVRNTYNVVSVAESKEIYYARPAAYGDASGSTPSPATPTPNPTPAPNPTPTPSPTPAPNKPPAGDCTVSDKLVNSCRPWLGAAANKYNVADNYQAQIEAHEKSIGRKVDIAHTYHSIGSNTLSSYDKYFINRSGTYLFTNWKPAAKWRDAAGGNSSINAAIDQMADSIKSVAPKKIFFTINHEPENDVSGGGSGCSISYVGSAGTPADYRNMWANVRKRFDARGATNVVWVMDYMNFSKWDCLVDDLYPGNDLVDWVMFNAYGYGSGGASKVTDNIRHFVDVMNNQQSSVKNFSGKPWGIVEWNAHDMPAANAYKFYDDMKSLAINKTFPNIKAFMVFDSIGPDGNDNRIAYTSDGKYDPTKLQHYKDLANSTAFTGQATPTPTPTPTPTTDTTPPSMPTGLRATTQTTSAISLSWNTSTDNVKVAGYRLRRNGIEVLRTTDTSITNSGLTANTAYSYTVDAYDAAGNFSAQSPALSVSTIKAADSQAPSAPANVTAQALSGTQIKITWNASSDNIGVTGYLVQRDGVTIAQLNSLSLTYTDTSVLPSTSYSYTVRARDAAGNVSGASAAALAATPAVADSQAPSAPANLRATVSGQQVNLTWNAATDNVGVKDYLVYRNGLQLTSSNTTNLGDGTVEAGRSYSYTVTARDAAGNVSASSPAISVSVPQQPATTNPHQAGLAGTYFANKTLTGSSVQRTDSTVDFTWPGAPVASLPADNFSVRWTGRVTPTNTGAYTFYTQSDDGVRLWVNNKLLIDDWTSHGLKENSATISLTKGVRYNIKLEYFEATGAASLKLMWSSPNDTKQVIPASQLVTSSYGLTGSYFNGQGLSPLSGSRLDSTVNFSWSGSPFSGVAADHYSVRWTGQVFADTTEPYTFYTSNNDGARLWVNGVQLVDDWTNHGTTEHSGTLTLNAGQKYDITMEFYDSTGQGVAQLLWSSPSKAKQIVPQGSLFDR